MRILFSSVGAYGHVIPLLPLAMAARDAGHEVTLATAESLHPLVRQAGLDPAAAGCTVVEAIARSDAENSPDQPRRDASAQAFGSILPRRAVADLAPILAGYKPDLVVYGVLNPGAAIAAAAAGIPALCHGIGRIFDGPGWQAMCRTWADTAAQAGFEAVAAADPQFLGNPFLDICPPSLQWSELSTPAGRFPLRPEAWRGQSAALPPIVHGRDPGRPLVYLTSGTAFNGGEMLNQAVAGLSVLPVDVLVAAGPRSGLRTDRGGLPANVVVEEWLPQADILPYADLVVSHGGSGTTLGCLAEGVPHLILPQGADQFSNAQAISDAGAGQQIKPADLTAEAVTRTARDLLADDAARESARRLAAEIAAMPSTRETVEQWASQYPEPRT